MNLPINYNDATWEERKAAREEYIRLQEGKCWNCKEPLDGLPHEGIRNEHINWSYFPGGQEGFLKYSIHLHHDHDTGLTEGAVHAFCNAFMWQYEGR